MKKILTTLAIVLVTATLTLRAEQPNTVVDAQSINYKETLRRDLLRQIPCPDFVPYNSDEIQVEAIVEISPEGKVHVLEVKSDDKRLVAYVTERMSAIKLQGSGDASKVMVRIKFRG